MFITRICVPSGQPARWPFTLAPIQQLTPPGLEFTRPVTFLVGENGSGKSTIIEAIADACKISSEGGKAGTKYASTGEQHAALARPRHRGMGRIAPDHSRQGSRLSRQS